MFEKLIKAQFGVLLLGTVFAWGNFGNELVKWLSHDSNNFACTAGVTNPFMTPCFYGALFFTLAFALSALLLLTVIRNKAGK